MKRISKLFVYLVISFLAISNLYAVQAKDDSFEKEKPFVRVSYTLENNNIIEENYIFDGSENYTIVRNISEEGIVTISKNDELIGVFAENQEIYKSYFLKIGTMEVLTEDSVVGRNILMSNYGCGYNQHIHQFIGRVTSTVYKSNISNASSTAMAAAIMARINVPMNITLTIASIVLNMCANNAPYKMIITRSMFDVKSVGSLSHLFFCYHVYTSCYNESNSFLGAFETYYQET